MSGLGIRILLCACAQWRGKPPLLLPTTTLPDVLGIERTRFALGRREVEATGLLILTKPYVKPGGAGSGARDIGRAAEFALPFAARGAIIPLEHGEERLPGYWRLLSDKLLELVSITLRGDGSRAQLLTDDQLRVVIALVQGPRTKGGALQSPARHHWTAQQVADFLPGLGLRTAQRALTALEHLKLARKVAGGMGRAPAIYEPAGVLNDGLPWMRGKAR